MLLKKGTDTALGNDRSPTRLITVNTLEVYPKHDPLTRGRGGIQVCAASPTMADQQHEERHRGNLCLLVQTSSAWSVKTRCAPSRRCQDARVSGHTTTVMHDNEAKQEGDKEKETEVYITWKARIECPNVGGVSIRCRKGTPSRKGCEDLCSQEYFHGNEYFLLTPPAFTIL